MKINLSIRQPAKILSDLQAVFVTEKFAEEIYFFDKKTKDLILKTARLENFAGKKDEFLLVDIHDLPSKRLLLCGISPEIKEVYDLLDTLAKTARYIKKTGRKRISLIYHPSWNKEFSGEVIGQIITEAFLLATYHFDKYKNKKEPHEKEKIEDLILLTTPARLASFEKGINMGKIFVQAVNFARDLVNEPASITTPSYLAQVAKGLGHRQDIKVTIFEREEIARLGMNCVLGVSQGSDHPPKFIRIVYRPPQTAKNKIVLIGKGITFDTGGLSLKPSQSMETMKIDMAGAASVLGVFSQIASLKPAVEVVGLIAACENMPSGKALHPGDILKALNGKTIEVLNTDAEGRLTLADVLSYAVLKEKPDAIIDLATLTGSCMVALGQEIAGLFGNNQALIKRIKEAAVKQGELIWELPLFEGYRDQIKSHIADLRNTSKTKYGGTITAALFLEEFVDKFPWVHLDIAGPAYEEKEKGFNSNGGTGFGVRLLLEFLRSYR